MTGTPFILKLQNEQAVKLKDNVKRKLPIQNIVGEVKEILTISFLRKYIEKKFVFSNVEDVSTVHKNYLNLHLQDFVNTSGTSITAKYAALLDGNPIP